ncbi:MAG: thioredoxin family protein [Actinomycetota bacterium]
MSKFYISRSAPTGKMWARAFEVVLDAFHRPETEVNYRLLSTSEDAAAVPFAGSPTILIDGEDLFPSAGRTADLACRLYFTPTGLAGLPTVEQIKDALQPWL